MSNISSIRRNSVKRLPGGQSIQLSDKIWIFRPSGSEIDSMTSTDSPITYYTAGPKSGTLEGPTGASESWVDARGRAIEFKNNEDDGCWYGYK
jgi:hypothetical protein